MLFFKKKEDGLSLPDLPPSQIQNLKPIQREVPLSPETLKSKPSLSEIDSEDEEENEEGILEKHALPSFPDAPNVKGFSQAAIKDAVGSGKEEGLIPKLQLPRTTQGFIPKTRTTLQKAPEPLIPNKNFKAVEMEEWSPEEIETKNEQATPVTMPKPAAGKSSNIYVRLDKFHTAKRSLEEIKSKVEEVEALLSKIREIKMREEQELSGWEKDIFNIKSRLQDVTDNIFERGE